MKNQVRFVPERVGFLLIEILKCELSETTWYNLAAFNIESNVFKMLEMKETPYFFINWLTEVVKINYFQIG